MASSGQGDLLYFELMLTLLTPLFTVISTFPWSLSNRSADRRASRFPNWYLWLFVLSGLFLFRGLGCQVTTHDRDQC